MVLWTEPPPSSCRDSLSGTFSPALPAAHRCQHLVPLAQLYKRSTRNVMNPLSPDQIYSETEQTDAWTCPKVTGRCEIKPISASPSSSLVLLLLLASIQQNYCPSYFRASVLPVTALVFCWQSLIFVKCLCLFLCSVNKAMHLLTQKFHVIVVDGTLPE